jgi:hypothetical protein
VIDALVDENHLGALGAFVGLDEDMARLRVFLMHMARLTGLTTRITHSEAHEERCKNNKPTERRELM